MFVVTAAVVMATSASAMTSPVVKYGCFNTMLEMGCIYKHVLVFDSARYGRNDTMVRISLLAIPPCLNHSHTLADLIEDESSIFFRQSQKKI